MNTIKGLDMVKRHRFIFYFVAICAVLFFFIQDVSASELDQEIQRIKRKGKITIAMHSVDVKPFFNVNEKGELVGFDVDIARDIASRIGVDLEFNRSAKTFDEVVELVANREADVAVSMLSNTLKRAMKVRFTEPYITLYRAIVVNRIELAKKKRLISDIFSALNLEGIKIGVIEGSSYVGFAKEDFPNATIAQYKEWDDVMDALLRGDIFAGQYDNNDTANWAYDHPESGLYIKTVLMKDKKDTLSFAVHHEDEYLLYWFNLYIQKIFDDGTYKRLMKKYFPDAKVNGH